MARRKFVAGNRVVANDKAPRSYAGMQGTVVEIGPGKAEYGVKFDGRPYPVEYLLSPWLDAIEHEQSNTPSANLEENQRGGLLP